MLHVLIVEDEPKIAGLIQELVDWEALGLAPLKPCYDGFSALEAIQARQPDIVLTDIRMPGIDGLELIRRARELGSSSQFIIISGYRQFEYAHNALRFGVDEYLLKPIQKEDLNNALRKLSLSLTDSRSNHKRVEAQMRSLRDAFMERLINGGFSPDILNNAARYEVSLREGCLQYVILHTERLLPFSSANKIVSTARGLWDPLCHEMIPYVDSQYRIVFLLNYAPGSLTSTTFSRFYQSACALMSAAAGRQEILTMGIGHAVTSFDELLEALRTADCAVSRRLQTGSGCLYCYDALTFSSLTADDVLTPDITQELDRHITALDPSALAKPLRRTLAALDAQTHPSVVRAVFERIAALINAVLPAQTAVSSAQARLQINAAYTLDALKEAFVCWCMDALIQAKDELSHLGSRHIQAVKCYINQNYNQPLTLNSVAEQVGLAPSYLSAIFKRETGQNFIDYLTLQRIQAAKQLLRGSDLPICEVGQAVGYSDNRYFSRIFTRCAGVKPSVYRKLN